MAAFKVVRFPRNVNCSFASAIRYYRSHITYSSSQCKSNEKNLRDAKRRQYGTSIYNPLELIEKNKERCVPTTESMPPDVLRNVNLQISERTHGRLFAVIYLASKQFKVTQDDLILVQQIYHADTGEKIILGKVLLVGSEDFTLLGRPILDTSLATVEATIIEKTYSQQKIVFYHEQRSLFERTYFHRNPYTILRINKIELKRPIDGHV
ncbi:MRPL21 (predicted) [Pycnogonum litorale]